MLSKLIKHEFRATARIMWPIFGGMLGLTVLMRFGAFGILSSNGGFFLNAIGIITVMIFFAGLFALAFAPMVASGSHFKSSVLGNEGYLTMTLPVSTDQLLVSKLITNAVWYAATAVLMLLIAFVLSAGAYHLGEIGDFISNIFRAFQRASSEEISHIVLIGFEMLVDIVTAVTLATAAVYAAYAIGYSANKHKTLWTVLLIYGFFHIIAYVGIATLILFGEEADRWVSFEVGVRGFEGFLGIGFVVMLALSAVFYFVTRIFLTHKLNLE